MSINRKIANILKKAGYKREAISDVNIYLKWYDDRFAAGFSLSKTQEGELAEVGYGLLDAELIKMKNKIENTEEWGLYHLTLGKALANYDDTPPIKADELIEVINHQILSLEHNLPEIIKSYRCHITNFEFPSKFIPKVPNFKSFGAIYCGLIYSLVENNKLTEHNINSAIEHATKLGVNNRDFQFKLSLLRKYTGVSHIQHIN